MDSFTVVEVRMGILLFLTQHGIVTGFDPSTGRFDRCLFAMRPEDRFCMALATCGGVFVRNLDPDAEIRFALAHVPSFELARRLWGLSHQQLREKIKREGRERFLPIISQFPTPAAEEMYASMLSPISGPDLLAMQVIDYMGKQLEVRVFGGSRVPGQSTPFIVSEVEKEFSSRGVKATVEPEFVDIPGHVPYIRPYAIDPAEVLQKVSNEASYRITAANKYVIVQTAAKIDG